MSIGDELTLISVTDIKASGDSVCSGFSSTRSAKGFRREFAKAGERRLAVLIIS